MIAPVALSAVALWAGGKPAQVIVEAGPGNWSGFAAVGGDHLWIGAQAARDAAHGGGPGLFVLLHETRHLQQYPDPDECDADRWALSMVGRTLRHFWPRLTRRQVAYRVADAKAWPGKYPCERKQP